MGRGGRAGEVGEGVGEGCGDLSGARVAGESGTHDGWDRMGFVAKEGGGKVKI